MPTGNFDEPLTSPVQPDVSRRRFRFPADYYSAPLSEVKPFLPKWAPWGCGGAAALFLILLFAGSSLLTGPRLNALIDLTIGMSLGEAKAMYAAGVTDDQKKAFDVAVTTMRENLRESKISAQNVQPFLKALQKAIGDRKLTPAEVDNLTAAAKQASRPKAG
jgi:hypothetical protein